MKVVYKKSVKEKIDDEVLKATLDNKSIEKIVLTKDEWCSFIYEIRDQYLYYTTCGIWIAGINHFPYSGVLVVKEDKENVV